MKQAWQFFLKYWKMFLTVLGIVIGAFMLRPRSSQSKDAPLNGLKDAEDKIREKRIEEQAKQATDLNTDIDQMNKAPPQKETDATAQERAKKSIDDIAKDYDKL